jgi:hypothetical protein
MDKIVCAVFIIFCIINYNKLIARFKKHKFDVYRKRMNAGDEYIKKIDELLR